MQRKKATLKIDLPDLKYLTITPTHADAQCPPSTLKSAPVMNELPAPSKKMAGALKSSGAPSRFNRAPAIQIFSSSGAVASSSSVMAVRM